MNAGKKGTAGLRSIRLPFVNTAPLTDLHLLIGLAPVFWLVGIEQFVALPLLSWSFLKYVLRGKGLRIGLPTLLQVAIIVVVLLSAVAIDSPMRMVTFVRTTAMYVMGLIVAILVAGECDSPEKVRNLLRTVVLMMAGVGAMSLMGVLGIADIRFRSLAGYLLPRSLAETGYGNQIVWRFLGNPSWFQGFGSYFRVSGIFLFSTMCAAASAITLPIAIGFVYRTKGWRQGAYLLAAMLIFVPFLFSTGRTAWLAFTISGVLVGILSLRLLPRLLSVLIVVIAATSLFFVMPPDFILDAVEETVYARGAGSTTSRLTIYRATLEGILERPILGWGTERDITTVDNFELPAGSHSHYLGFLYKHGLIGLAALLAFMAVIMWQIWATLRAQRNAGENEATVMLSFVGWSLLTAALTGLTSVLDLDATLALLVWVTLFSGLQLRYLIRTGSSK